jgi:hypothetical protein
MRVVWINGCLCLAVAFGCAASPRPPETPSCEDARKPVARSRVGEREQVTDANLLQLAIAPATDSGEAQDHVRVTIRNVSDQYLWLSYALRSGPKSMSEFQIWFEAISATGQTREEEHCAYRLAPPDPDAYFPLAPGAEYSVLRSVACFAFPDKGPWRLTAHYKDRGDTLLPPPEYARWFSGEIVSNTIEVEVQEPPKPRAPPPNDRSEPRSLPRCCLTLL